MAICRLDKEINSCPYFDKDSGVCNSESAGCGMREEIISQPVKSDEREDRWYEPFMHGTRRMK